MPAAQRLSTLTLAPVRAGLTSPTTGHTMRPVDEQWIEILRIQALCARYCLTIDTQDGEGWAGCFTEDGAFEFDGWVIRGRPALREYADAHARVVRGRHLTTDLLYEVDGDVATGRSASVVTLATAAGYKILGSRRVPGSPHQAGRPVAYRVPAIAQRSAGVGSQRGGKRRRCRRRRGRRSPSRGRAPARNPDERHVGATS